MTLSDKRGTGHELSGDAATLPGLSFKSSVRYRAPAPAVTRPDSAKLRARHVTEKAISAAVQGSLALVAPFI